MKSRCYCETTIRFADYGGRGISVCDRWRDDFAAFLADVGQKPTPKHSLDRIDVDGNYEPGNVRWATIREQNTNTRRSIYATIDGVTLPIIEWAEKNGLYQELVAARLRRGWSPEDAVSLPPSWKHLKTRKLASGA
jgi:hypothetical protein